MGLTIGISAVLFGLSQLPLAINSVTPLINGNNCLYSGRKYNVWCHGRLPFFVLWFRVYHHRPRIFPYRLISNTWLGESDHNC
nr:ORF82 [Synechocystis sp. PCC 6803]